MKIGRNNLDEIVFQERNKNYGAYHLRKLYPRNLSFGIYFTLTLCILFILVTFFNQYLERKRPAKYIEYSVSAELLSLNTQENPEELARKKRTIKEEIFTPGQITDSVKEIIKEKIPEELIDNETDTTGSNTGYKETNGTNSAGGGQVFLAAEKMPQFPGGKSAIDKFLQENIKIPNELRQQKNKKGKLIVQVKFCVKNDGSIDMVSIYKGADPLLDTEAIRIVKAMPRWLPGMQGGEPVNVWCAIPIRFVL